MTQLPPGIERLRRLLARSLLGASLTAACLGATTMLAPGYALAQTAVWQAQQQPVEFVRGQKYWSGSRSHFVVLKPDGNLVVAKADGGYVWGFDTQPNIDFRRVGRVVWQPDGNLVAYAANGGYLWSALTKDPDPGARLVLQSNGALQIVSQRRGVLWSSDGNRSAAAPAEPMPAPPAPPSPPPAASAPATPAPSSAGNVANRFPIVPGQTLSRGTQLASSSGNHLLILQDGGNLVVTRKDKGYLWGFDRVQGLNFRQVDRVALQPDGNFVALNASGAVIWRALASNPDPSAQLILTAIGGLQLVSPSRGVLWASDGVLIPEGVAGKGFPFTKGQVIPPDVEFTSPSRKHVLTFQSSGNLVVASAGKDFRWGLNLLPNVDFKQVRSVRMSNDGNLVALNASGKPIWKALDANPDPAARLELSYSGALQLVSPSRGILWSNDGILTQPVRVESGPAGLRACQPEEGWAKCVLMASPAIKIMGTQRVSDKAMKAVASVYTEVFARLKPAFPRNSFDGFRVYITNGESERQLAALPVVGAMWTDGYGPKSRATLRGGASLDYLWIEEQMICKEGIVTRNEDFAAGRVPAGDKAYRTFDQVVHEMGHSIDMRFKLMDTRLRQAYPGDPTEQFPQGVQAWFGAPVREFGAREKALLDDLFTSRAVFSCEGVAL
ncbi:MAG: hypothetical protein RL684_2109 [Pseudomonadota bacterium]|jgi:outer membrane protein assembly factor BamB